MTEKMIDSSFGRGSGTDVYPCPLCLLTQHHKRAGLAV